MRSPWHLASFGAWSYSWLRTSVCFAADTVGPWAVCRRSMLATVFRSLGASSGWSGDLSQCPSLPGSLLGFTTGSRDHQLAPRKYNGTAVRCAQTDVLFFWERGEEKTPDILSGARRKKGNRHPERRERFVRPQSKDVRGLESLRSFGSVPPWRSALRSGQAPLTEIVHCAQTDVVSFEGRRVNWLMQGLVRKN